MKVAIVPLHSVNTFSVIAKEGVDRNYTITRVNKIAVSNLTSMIYKKRFVLTCDALTDELNGIRCNLTEQTCIIPSKIQRQLSKYDSNVIKMLPNLSKLATKSSTQPLFTVLTVPFSEWGNINNLEANENLVAHVNNTLANTKSKLHFLIFNAVTNDISFMVPRHHIDTW